MRLLFPRCGVAADFPAAHCALCGARHVMTPYSPPHAADTMNGSDGIAETQSRDPVKGGGAAGCRQLAQYNFVRIIVAGEVFKTLRETLDRYPGTLLGSHALERYWDSDRQAYVFTNRCRRSFESILYFYQSNGILSQPKNVLENTFIEEVEFFKIPRNSLRVVFCGVGTMKKRTISKNTNTQWSYKSGPAITADRTFAYPPSNVRYTGLCTTVSGEKTLTYKVIMMCDLVATLLLVFCHIVSTIKIKVTEDGTEADGKVEMANLLPELLIDILELTCILWILIHYIAGLVIAANRMRYVKSFMPMVDAIIVLAVMLDHLLHWVGAASPTDMPIRAIGVLRLFNLARHSNLLYCLGLALRQSFSDLIHVLFVIVFIMFLAAGFVYFAEQPPCGQYDNVTKICSYNISLPCEYHRECSDNQTDYISIFASSYWAAVTITTVGYGDMIPKTTFGKIVGSILALIGLPLIAIPMPLIMTKFEKLYSSLQEQQKEGKRQDDSEQEVHATFSLRSASDLKKKASFVFFGEYRPEDDTMDRITHATISNLSVTGDNIPEEDSYVKSGEVRGTENGGEPDKQSWTENWKQVYGRCPTGMCNEADCRQCNNRSNGANNRESDNGY